MDSSWVCPNDRQLALRAKYVREYDGLLHNDDGDLLYLIYPVHVNNAALGQG